MIKKNDLVKIISIVLIIILLSCACDNNQNKNIEESSHISLTSKIEDENYDFNKKLENFYSEEQVKEVMTDTRTIIEQAQKNWNNTEILTGTIKFDYSNIQPNFDIANFYYEGQVYPLALDHCFIAKNYALRVITYYKLEKGLVTKDELYNNIKIELDAYKSKYEELKSKSIEYEKYINKEDIINLAAAQFLINTKLVGIRNRLKNLDYDINNEELVHTIGAAAVNYKEFITIIKNILDNINTQKMNNLNNKISNEVINRSSELSKRLEVLLSMIDEEEIENPEYYLIKDAEWLMNRLKEDINEGFVMQSYFSIDRVRSRIELAEQIINGNFLTTEELFDKIVLYHKTLYKKIQNYNEKDIDIRWLNSRFSITSAYISNLMADIVSTYYQGKDIGINKELEFKRKLYVNIADIFWLEYFTDKYEKL